MSGNITIDSTTKALMDDAATGEAARMFLQSDLGKYIIAEATAQCDEATAELIDCVPTDSVKIAELQFSIHCAKGASTWLTDAITRGDQSLRLLYEQHD